MMDSKSALDPHKSISLSSRVLLRLRQDGVDQQVLNLLRTACDQALAAEGMVLSQMEKDRLVKEIALSIVDEKKGRFV